MQRFSSLYKSAQVCGVGAHVLQCAPRHKFLQQPRSRVRPPHCCAAGGVTTATARMKRKTWLRTHCCTTSAVIYHAQQLVRPPHPVSWAYPGTGMRSHGWQQLSVWRALSLACYIHAMLYFAAAGPRREPEPEVTAAPPPPTPPLAGSGPNPNSSSSQQP